MHIDPFSSKPRKKINLRKVNFLKVFTSQGVIERLYKTGWD